MPFHIKAKVGEAIDKLLQASIIEKVEEGTPWVSPIVEVPKPNNEEVRLCIDMHQVNRAILRQQNSSVTIEDILFAVNGSRWFSKIYLKSAYHKIEMHPDSRYLTTFITHHGLWRYCRLNFRIFYASEIFQQTVADLLIGIPGVLNVVDNNNNNKHFFNLQVANSPSRLRFEANLSRESSECTEHSQDQTSQINTGKTVYVGNA